MHKIYIIAFLMFLSISLSALREKGSLLIWGSMVGEPIDDQLLKIDAGDCHSLAIRSDSSLVAWGRNNHGQCNIPAGNFKAISAGVNYTIALRSDGSLIAWGGNEYGQCNVPQGNDFVAIDTGYYHNLALKSDGSMVAWGYSIYGLNTVPEGNNFIAISVGGDHNLALKSNGSVVAWGDNLYGQINVPGGNNFVAISAGGSHSLYLRSDGSLVARGDNSCGQCNVPSGNNFVAISAGGLHCIALKTDHSLVAWGLNEYGACNVPSGNNYTAISGGGSHSLALQSDGELKAWGDNEYSQCGLPLGDNCIHFSGDRHFLALGSDSTLVAWGYSDEGACNVPVGHYIDMARGGYHSLALKSNGTLVSFSSHSYGLNVVPTTNDFKAVAAGEYHNLALKNNGSLVAWGDNQYGQSNVPPGSNFVAISSGWLHDLALRSDNTVAAWGQNNEGQCNLLVGSYKAISAGESHSLALKTDGTLSAWGSNTYGQCNVPLGNDYVAIAAGSTHNMALKSDGSIIAWGSNTYGQCNVPDGHNFVSIAAGSGFSVAIEREEPILTLPTSLTFAEDDNLVFDMSLYATEILNTSLMISVQNSSHISAAIEGTIVTLSAAVNWSGEENITFTVDYFLNGYSKGKKLDFSKIENNRLSRFTTSVTTSVIVTPINDAPIVNIPSTYYFPEDSNLIVDISPFISDVDNTELTVSAQNSSHVFVSFDGLNAAFTAEDNWNGTEDVTFSVSDGSINSTEQVSVTVTPVNDAPVIILPNSFTFEEDGSLIVDLSLYAHDIDNTDITFNAQNSTHITVSISGTVATLTASTNWIGTEEITFTVNDNTGRQMKRNFQVFDGMKENDLNRLTASATTNIIVTPINHVPIITSFIPQQTNFDADLNEQVSFSILAEDVDLDDTLSYSWYVNYANQNNDTNEFTYEFIQGGLYQIKTIVSDGSCSVEQMWTINVPVDNHDPVLIPLTTKLYGNYPNPFNPDTTIRYSLKVASKVNISIFNTKGRLIKVLNNEYQKSGIYQVTWNGKDNKEKVVASGIYLVKMQTDQGLEFQKITLLK
jgi:alpha-tubulin suppressor-like RCC1 family protein